MTGADTVEIDHVHGSRGRAAVAALVLLVLAALLASVGVAQPAHAATPRLQLTLTVSNTEFLPGQSVMAHGNLASSSGAPIGGHRVNVQKQTSAGWTTIATTTTVASGRYAVYVREAGSFVLRTQVNSYNGELAAGSTPIQLTKVGGTQTLEQREAHLAPWLGAARSGVKSGIKYGTALRFRAYQNGMLVEGAGRVYVVWGAQWSAYAGTTTWASNAPLGKLGRPISDADCYLTTATCIQPFARGAIYHDQKSVTARKTHIAYGIGTGAELIAAAMSQVGYREPAWQTNKYTEWNKRKAAWCGIFHSYNSAITKNGQAVPQVKIFSEMVAEVKRRGITEKPRVGALVFIDFAGGSNVTHVGIVTKVNRDGSVQTIEGNTVVGGDPKRVVAVKTRTAAQAVYFYVPGT